MKLPFVIASLLFPALAFPGKPPSAAPIPCERWMTSIQDYDQAFERVMRGEPEDLLQFVQAARDPAGKNAARKGAAEKLAGLEAIDPPPELAPVHRDLVAYARAVVRAVEAARPSDTGPGAPALRPCYQALLDYYVGLRELMRRHDCRGGDLEALEQRVIPQLEAMLNAGDRGEDGAIAP